jgi:adenosylhomocysteine nucleosidase
VKAIIAALPREVSGLVRGVRPEPEARRAGVFLYRLPGCLVVCAGMGTVRATLAVEAAMRSHEIDELLSVGLAGGCHPEVAVGSVVEAGTVIDALSGERFSGAAGASGVLVTTHTIASITEKIRLFASYRADVVDMEAATVARLATMHGIGFRAFKAVSDGHDFELSSLSRFASAHGHFRTGAFALHTALRPHHWRKTMRLGSASQRALSALTAVLRDEVLKGL